MKNEVSQSIDMQARRNVGEVNTHQSNPSLRVGLKHKFRRCQSRAVGARQCGAVVNTLKVEPTAHSALSKLLKKMVRT